MTRNQLFRRLLVGAIGLAHMTALPASATITPTSDATALGQAIVAEPASLAAATFAALPPQGTPHAVSDSALRGFPSGNGSPTYSILTTGDATLADAPNAAGDAGAANSGANVRGNRDYDVSILRLDLNVPAGRNCLIFDFQFFSEEYPEDVGSNYNDAFIAELNSSNWTTKGRRISDPNNFARDPSGGVISVSATGFAAMTAADAFSTTYDGATTELGAATTVSSSDGNGALAGNNSIYLSIFDHGDDTVDSAVFVDDLRLITVSDATTQCLPGARGSTELIAFTEIISTFAPNLSARLTAPYDSPLEGKAIEFYTTDPIDGTTSFICSASTASSGVATCGGPAGWLSALGGRGFEARFNGDALWAPANAAQAFI